jgi:hypothetical protein
MNQNEESTKVVRLYQHLDQIVDKSLGRPSRKAYSFMESFGLIIPIICIAVGVDYFAQPELFEWKQVALAALKTFVITHCVFFTFDFMVRRFSKKGLEQSKLDFKNLLVDQVFEVQMVQLNKVPNAHHRISRWFKDRYIFRNAIDDKKRAVLVEYYSKLDEDLKGYLINLKNKKQRLNFFYPDYVFIEQQDFQSIIKGVKDLAA